MITQTGRLAVNAGNQQTTLLPNLSGANPLISSQFQVDTEPTYVSAFGIVGNNRVVIEMATQVNGAWVYEPWRPARVEVAALTTELTTLMINIPGNYRLRQELAGNVTAVTTKGSTTHDIGSYYAKTLSVVTAVNSVNTVGDSSLTLVAAPTIGDVIVSGSVRTDLNPANLIERRVGGLMVDGSQIIPFLIYNAVDTDSIDHTFALGTLSSTVRISPQVGNTLSVVSTPGFQGLFSNGGGVQVVQDTSSIDLTLLGSTLSGVARISPAGGNQVSINVTPGLEGLYVPTPPLSPVTAVLDTFSVDMTLNAGLLSSNVRLNPNPLNLITVDGTGLYVNKADSIDVANTSTVLHNYSGAGVLTSNVNIQPHPLQLLRDDGLGLFAHVDPQSSNTIGFFGWSPNSGNYSMAFFAKISTDPNNALAVGTDLALFVPSSAAPLISSVTNTNSITHTTPAGVLTSNVRISAAANNIISVIATPGLQGLYVPPTPNFIQGTANTPTVTLLVSGVTLTANAVRDPSADNVTIFNVNGIMTPFSDILVRMPRSTRVVQGITQYSTEPQIEAATNEIGGGGGFAVTTKSLSHIVNSRQSDSSARLGVSSVSLPFSAAVGYGAGFGATGARNFFGGTGGGENNSGSDNVLIGFGNSFGQSRDKSVVIGGEAGFNNTVPQVSPLVAVGFRANTGAAFGTNIGAYSGPGNLPDFPPNYSAAKNSSPTVAEVCLGYRAGFGKSAPILGAARQAGRSRTVIGAFAGSSADYDQSALFAETQSGNGQDGFVAVGTNAGAGATELQGVTAIGDYSSFASPGAKSTSVGYLAGSNAGFRTRTNNTGINDNFSVLGGNTSIGALSAIASGPARVTVSDPVGNRNNRNTAVGFNAYGTIDDQSGIPGFAAETLFTFASSAIDINNDTITIASSLVPALIANGIRAGVYNAFGTPLDEIFGHRFVALLRTSGTMPTGFLNSATDALSDAAQVLEQGNEVHVALYYDVRQPLIVRLAPGQAFVTQGTGNFSVLIPGMAKAKLQNVSCFGADSFPIQSNEVVLGDGNVTRLRTAGSVVSAGAVSPSDARLKINVETFSGAEALINQLRPVKFDWDGQPDFQRTGVAVDPDDLNIRQHGLIAQEAREVMPSIVKDVGTGYLAVDYARCVPLLISCVQELLARTKDLEEKNESLNDKLDAFRGGR